MALPKKKDNVTPPINASSPDEENFIKCVVLDGLGATRLGTGPVKAGSY
jgi:hypothetical protein